MNGLRSTYSWLSDSPRQLRGLRALQVCIGLMLLFRTFTEAPHAAYLWGPNGIGTGSTSAFLPDMLAVWADRLYASDLGVYATLLLMATGASAMVMGYQTRLAVLISLFSFRVLESRLPLLGDGGDNITRLVLMYMAFALPAGKVPGRGSLLVWFHNIAILAIGLQLGVLYLTSGLMKAMGEKWTNGTALYLISQVEWFSHPSMRGAFVSPWVTALATYGTLFFQLWFPIAVLTRLKPIFLFVGISLHLGIAVFMGLICFSSVMIGLELFLITDAEYAKLDGLWSRSRKRLEGWFSLLPGRPGRLDPAAVPIDTARG